MDNNNLKDITWTVSWTSCWRFAGSCSHHPWLSEKGSKRSCGQKTEFLLVFCLFFLDCNGRENQYPRVSSYV